MSGIANGGKRSSIADWGLVIRRGGLEWVCGAYGARGRGVVVSMGS